MYRFLHVDNDQLLEKVFRFRYKIMHEELRWITYDPSMIEQDKYDRYADQFAIIDHDENICCTMRLIHHSPIGYPTERFLDLSRPEFRFEREKLSEMSRIFIDRSYRNMHETKIFLNSIVKSLAYSKIKEHGIEFCYGMLEQKFLKLVNMFKIPYQPISDLKQDYDRLKHPSILYVKDLEQINPQLIKQWEKLSYEKIVD